MKLKGKKALITGANQGLGLAIAEAFVDEGADIFIGARNQILLEQKALRLREKAVPGQQINTFKLDVADRVSVDAFMSRVNQAWGALDILVNNAGVYGPKGFIEEVNWKEWVEAIQINLMGTVYMCRVCLPLLRKSPRGKIINLSGGGATSPQPGISAYGASKAGVVRFTETLAEELRESGVDVNIVAPGALNTRLLDEVLEAGPEKVDKKFYEKAVEQKKRGGTPLSKGADLCVYLASEKSDGITGKLISAVWDPWETLQEHKGDLDKKDVYTLRRIVPKDRGLKWGLD